MKENKIRNIKKGVQRTPLIYFLESITPREYFLWKYK